VTIVTDAFEPLAQTVGGAAGLARVPVLVLRHPAGTLSEAALREQLRAALPALLEAAFGQRSLAQEVLS
jgi:hypothetical protein